MRKTLLSLSILAALGLAGCGDKPANTPSAGVSTSAGNSEDMSQRQSLSRDGKETVSQSGSRSSQMPAWGLLTSVAQEFWGDNGIGVTLDPDPESATLWEREEAARRPRVAPVSDDGGCTDGLGPRPVGQASHADLIALGACGEALALADAIIQAARGGVGWPKGVGVSSKRAAGWSVPKARLAEFANQGGEWLLRAAPLPSDALENPEDAKRWLRERLVYMAQHGIIPTLWSESRLRGSFVANFSGQAKYPVEFSIDGVTYGRDQNGWHILRNGLPWFGDGKVAGQDFTIAMQSSSSIDQSQGWSLSQDGGSGTRSETRGEAGIR